MDCRHSSCSPVRYPSLLIRRHGKRCVKADSLLFDVFVSGIYIPHARQRKRSWHVDERIARQHLFPVFGHRELARITRSDVEQWLQGLSAKGLAPVSCNRILAVFKSICGLARIHGALPGQSPCEGIPAFKIHGQRERCLTCDEARRLMRELKASARPEALVLQLLLLTGARKSEILKARWENLHLQQRLLTVPLSKSGKPRAVPGFFRDVRQTGRFRTYTRSGTGSGINWALGMCVSTTCAIPLPVCWSMPDTPSMKCKGCSGTATRAPLTKSYINLK